MKRKVSYIIIGILVIGIAVIATCNIIVNNNAKGRVFDNPADVPAMKTAVFLEQAPKADIQEVLISSSKPVLMLQ